MRRERPFLTARWSDLVLVNYEVPPETLRPRLPRGIELDDQEGAHYVSLVGFRFYETRVRGVKIPGHHDFFEVNLRFYVRRMVGDEVRRGVVFVKEIVARRAVALVARIGYGEPYETWSVEGSFEGDRLGYQWHRPGDGRYGIEAELGWDLSVPEESSHEAFLLEHYWGYTRRGAGRTDEYRVEHPRWAVREVVGHHVECDFGALYGPEFAFLTGAAPRSVVYAAGSEVAVFQGSRLV